ncbi:MULTISPECIES: RHS repeat-associated core domain-containing protein [unclassified Pseudomonas]|uniref:RHS repeat-associated core domain-containing protein n=1 Tax=unclassified Pseudomonas TaxID=196821 RepID=UPI002A35C057|nr:MULTISPECIES: RHS repeat-associated core domain-containing protein [unclassified Pseudomonas]MDX9673655.1 RHS repeat-associated core domain-containing protein [Pseudomonas sp. P8_250]WPN37815.1 RHS repeat-associated core domain-containing protein [Pseudomonas sp. P8_139]WPN40382.1 RHS repeat-associated core domain-containing protein [Pseudomonas sp. P8_229]
MDTVSRIEQELDSFPDTLSLYRQQLEHWFSRAADQVSHAADLPSLMGMERIIRFGDRVTAVSTGDNEFFSNVVQCPQGGVMAIESKFESVYDIPLGDIVVDVVAADGGEITPVTLDAQGKGSFTGEAGKFYRVQVRSEVTPEQINDLFAAYGGLTRELDGWLRSEWQGFKPQWSQSVATAAGNGMLAGSWAAIEGVWDSIGMLSEILQNPGKFAERLGSAADDLIKLAQTAPQVMQKLQLLVSDEAALCLLLRAASLWLEMLPPSEIAGKTAEAASMVVVQLLIDVLIGIVLTFVGAGAGIAYLTLRLADRAAQLLSVVKRLVKAMFGIVSTFIEYVDRYKKVAARGIAAGVKKGRLQLRWDAKRNASLKKNEHHDDSPDQAKNPNGDSADCVPFTCTNGCPVSMVTGEELLTLSDGSLDGVLPFEFTRLYRTSAVEIDVGLGFGWSHSLAHRLAFDGDAVVWVDHENRRTRFPLPSVERPAIHNSLSRAAIFLGDEPEELIVALAGDVARFYHFRAGRLTAISDAYGNRLRVARDHQERIVRLDNGAGRSLLLRYERAQLVAVDYQSFGSDGTGWHTEQTLASYRYDARQRLLEATNAVGDSERYDYDDAHVILQRQLTGGASFFWEWERSGKAARCVRHWASFSQMDTRYVWADDGSVAVHYVDGSEETYVHDDRARLVRKVEADGGEHLKVYDAAGRLIAEQDPLGAVTEYRYDEVGRLVALLPPQDEPTSYEYRNGFLHRRSRGEAVWTWRRNAEGDVTEAVDPDGLVTYYYYDTRGQLLSIRYPDSSRHQLAWNDLGQLIEETLPDGGVRRFSYDALGRRTTSCDEHGAITRQQWDAVGRRVQTTVPTGATRAYSYGAYGQLTAERDELGRITRYEYDDDLHLVSRRINPDGTRVQYRYDHAQLLLTEIENESGEKYRLDYTPTGLIRQETGFDGRRTAYAYDRNGHLLEKTEFGDDGSTLVTAYARDTAGRLLLKTLPDGVQVAYTYDRLGRLTGVDDGQQHPLAFEYDRQDRLITEHQGWGTLRYAYDACGQLKHQRLPDNSKLDYHYAKGGALTAIDLNGARLTSHVYQSGREQQRQQGLLRSDYAYDDQGRLLAHAVGHQHDSLYRRDYAYSANGNLEHIADTRHGQRTYAYDALDQLIRVRHSRDELPESFAHDPAGNLLMQDRPGPTNIHGNRLLMQGDRHYDYDAFGNLIRERRGRDQQLVTEYRYDCQHRLIGLTRPDGNTASYQYDAFGRRIRKTVDGQSTEFFWQGDHLVAESSPTHHRSYVYEPGTFRPLALLDGKGPKKACPFYYQLDHLGTPQELTDYSGDIVWSAQYDAYGKVSAITLAGEDYLDQPLRFQGQYFDAESGLHYNRHRHYDPRLGRYLTPDPIKLAGGLNQYRYVPNPTGWVDPLGLSSNCPPPNRPGCPVPGDVSGVKVHEGEPALPKMTAQERRARIDTLAEANAKREVLKLEKKYKMHTVAKHNPEISDKALKQRSIDGSHPTQKGQKGPIRPSSQFKTWLLQLNAINDAVTRMERKNPTPTGYTQDGDPVIRKEMPGGGRGYKPNKKDKNNPKFIKDLNFSEVRFDQVSGRPYTAFPD